MSSLADLAKLMQTLLNPSSADSLLSPYTLREWFRPLHAFWDDYSEIGAPWEIYKFRDSYGRVSRMFQKGEFFANRTSKADRLNIVMVVGELHGHHTIFTINPTSSFGVIILTTGPSTQTYTLNDIVFPRFQRASDMINYAIVTKTLVGTWASACCQLDIRIEHGSLTLAQYTINGTDVLKTIRPDRISRSAQLIAISDTEYRCVLDLLFPTMKGNISAYQRCCLRTGNGLLAPVDCVGRIWIYPWTFSEFVADSPRERFNNSASASGHRSYFTQRNRSLNDAIPTLVSNGLYSSLPYTSLKGGGRVLREVPH